MAWTFDYTVVFALGSLFFAFIGATIFYFGMIISLDEEYRLGKIGYKKKFNKVESYQNGIEFVFCCVAWFIIFSFILLIFIFILNFCISIKYPSYNLAMEIYTHIIYCYYIVLIAQFIVFIWGVFKLRYRKMSDNYVLLTPMLSYPTTLSLIFAAYFLINISNKIVMPQSFLLQNVASRLIYFVLFPLILSFLIITILAEIFGDTYAKLDLDTLETSNSFVVHLIDGKILDGQKLEYKDGIYILIKKHDFNGKIDKNYTIYEDKIQYIERIY